MDWINVEKNTPDKPEMKRIARECGVTNADAFIGWFRVWVWLDSETADGFVKHMVPDDFDGLAGVSGFGKALAVVGWVEFSPHGALVMGWEKHNGRNAKARALHATRQSDYRKKPGNDNGFRPWKNKA